ncbi:MAG TPA: hypothetical protein ENJ04_09100 [Nitrospirae bacterium]|nr:hypothetical protein [Nitrospirota bacterium]
MKKKFCMLVAAAFSALLLVVTGCSSGGGGSSTTTSTGVATALRVAEKVSVVDAKDSGSSGVSPLTIGVFQVSPSDLPADSDYFNDESFVYVEERSTEAFNLINEILCMMSQTRYAEMLNKGAYKAQIDVNQCSSSKDSAKSAGQSSTNQTSGTSAPEYEMWIVDSSRTDASSPHIVKVWVSEEGDEFEPPKVIYVKVTITEGVSDTNPYGLFTMNFKAYPVVNGTVDTSTAMFKGILKTEKDSSGKVILSFVINGGFDTPDGSISFSQKVALDRSADGTSGAGTVYTSDTYPTPTGTQTDESSFNIAFNQDYFLRVDTSAGTQVCLSRTSFDETAWRYGLYDSSGSRVVRNSGFPIKVTQNGVDYYGWIGFWGLWFPEDATLNSGDTVYKLSYGSGGDTEEPYNIFIAGGKLVKHTKKELTLGDIKNVPLDWWDPTGGSNYRVVWTGTEFSKVAVLNDTTWMWEDITPTPLDLTALYWTELNFWSQSLGGNVQVKLDDPADTTDDCVPDTTTGTFDCSGSASDTTKVVFFSEDMVYPDQLTQDLNLVCFENCPDPSNINGATPYFTDSTPESPSNILYQDVAPSSATNYAFTFDAAGMVLKYSGSNVVLTSADSPNEWGVTSGPLFVPTTDNLNALACDWDTTGSTTCAWQAWSNLSEFYTWETGLNEWNRFTALKDANNNFLTFDPPLPVEYTHTQTDTTKPDYKYNGSKFYLEYNGFGDLFGIPGKCVDLDSGEDESCDETSRWVPELTISDGSEVVDSTDGTTTYLVKALEKEQRMKAVATTNCSGLSTTTYSLPSIDDWVDPAIGDAPEVSGAPAVIGGVIQQ